jgi:membrane associated rhomboid family serine protease
MEETPPPLPYYQPAPPPWYKTLTGGIILLNVAVFVAQIALDLDELQFHARWALDIADLKAGNWWRLLTYQFLHGGPIHLLFNCLLISVMGRIVEMYFGKWRFLSLYLLGGVLGGLCELGIDSLLHRPDVQLIGASAGAAGLLACFATVFPFERLKVLFFFVIPIAMSARTLLWASIIISVVGVTGIIPGNIAHGAHLGGLLFGILGTKILMRRQGTP